MLDIDSIYHYCIFPFVCRYIEEEDLLRFLSKEEVTYVLPLFEGAVERKIKKSALRNWVVIY